ncbi:MAG TPA: hypothetical protein VK836_22780 [Streptosporangiaceae bacterium]|nr:hypothetical protein [Streptosporangiaceae bacterium]
MFGDVAAGGNFPIAKPGGDWRAFVMEIVLTSILVSVILHTATGSRSIGHNAANFTGWWAYVGSDLIGAAIAVALIDLVRGLPDNAEISAGEASPR